MFLDRTPRVLLVDDDLAFCQMLCSYLQVCGFRVTTVHSGEASLLEATGDACDLVILAERLPGMSGKEVLRHIRRQGDLPVMMLSAKDDDIDCIAAFELGADGYLSKSCHLREVVARSHAILRRT